MYKLFKWPEVFKSIKLATLITNINEIIELMHHRNEYQRFVAIPRKDIS